MSKAKEIQLDGAFTQMAARFDMCAAYARLAACVPGDIEKMEMYLDGVEEILPAVKEHTELAMRTIGKTRTMIKAIQEDDFETATKIAKEIGIDGA